ncbi:hypothetical protein M501DRAFT_1004501 [Patellaria atrata CBS 101060]|uniref:Nuclear pore complex protein n=1 Tax=Patellaria atrata CBS 101060 TaxID=1346257 RepID=A0A9P4VMI3_9PEZI|nr:hypothetical protein M501DRAFT_1004501 [Patellaria atrata CBS 101060]
MAPITRRSQSLRTSAPVLAERLGHREESWEHLNTNGISNDTMASNRGQRTASLNGHDAEDDQLHPLRHLADRVGSQVDDFAKRVDVWYNQAINDKKNGGSELDTYNRVLSLVDEFKTISDNTVQRLSKKHRFDHEKSQKAALHEKIKGLEDSATHGINSRGELGVVQSATSTSTSVQDLTQWQAEADTWDLFRTLLDFHRHPTESKTAKEKRDRLQQLSALHQYTPPGEIWERYILESDNARERNLILRWLEKTADRTESDISSIVDQLESQSGKGKGLWQMGWLDTREKIKAQKRMRPWNSSRGTDELLLRSSTNSNNIVTQLDPDAPSRQKKSLERADEYHEKAIWLTCWEMLRRGKSIKEIHEWFEEQTEGWRALSMGMSFPQQDLHMCVSDIKSGGLWRRICLAAAEASTNQYEKAVYGLLSGDISTVEPVCRTWDDYLFVRLNSLLLSEFDHYLQERFPQRIPSSLKRKFGLTDAIQIHGERSVANRNVIQFVDRTVKSKDGAINPIKVIQGSLIAGTFEEFARKLGIALAKKANAGEIKSKLIQDCEEPVDEEYMSIAHDYDALRMVAHILIIYMGLGMRIDGPNSYLYENVLVGYIDYLRLSGKIEVYPTYAALLPVTRCYSTIARVLPDIRATHEQRRQIRLLKMLGLHPIPILFAQCSFIFHESDFKLLPNAKSYLRHLSLLEPTAQKIWPQSRLREDLERGLLDTPLSPSELGVVRAAGWFMLIPGEFEETFLILSTVLQNLLVKGRISAARALCEKVPFKDISLVKTPNVLGRAIHIMEDAHEDDEEEVYEPRRSTRSGSRRPSPLRRPSTTDQQNEKLLIRRLQEIARPYYDLQQLVNAIEALNEWNKVERETIAKRNEAVKNPEESRKRQDKSRLKRAFEHVQSAMEPLFRDFLTHAEDLWQKDIFNKIKCAYLPELILAFDSVIHSSAQFLGRDQLLIAMDLATAIADEENAPLADCFVESKRMGELVAAFAENSLAMLEYNEGEEQRRGPKKKRGWAGQTIGIWNLGVSN